LRFEPNAGQTDARVRFLARGTGYSVFLTASEAVLALRPPAATAPPADPRLPSLAAPEAADRAVLRLRLPGARLDPEITGRDDLPGRSHYLRGRDPGEWRTNIPNYRSVRYAEVYPRVDLVYRGGPGHLEYDFVVAPGGDPRAIRLAFEGADAVDLDAAGDLVLRVAGGIVRQHRPVTYQEVDGERRVVPSRYIRARDGFRIEVDGYDRSRTLVIDPALVYSTYLGGNNMDSARAVAIDAAGYAYVAGLAESTNFPPPGPVQPGGPLGADAFVLKLDPSGTALVYSTYLGGSGWDDAFGIAIDAFGAAYLTGYTSSPDFPTAGPNPSAFGGVFDAFVSKIDPSGTALVLSRYLTGTGYDFGSAVAVDAQGSPYVTGWTTSTNFPTTPAPILQATSGGAVDAFVTKLDPNTFALAYSTYLGGTDWELTGGIAVDREGFAYVVGGTYSSNFPVVTPTLQSTLAGAEDAFVAKLDRAGTTLVYSTYLGGKDYDVAAAVAVDRGGRAYVTGQTSSRDFPVKLRPPATTVYAGGVFDAFVAKLEPSGTALTYSRYLGGSDADEGTSIGLWDNLAYVTGDTLSSDFPLQKPVQATLQGARDAFVTRLDGSGAGLAFSTYLGGSDSDFGQGIAVAPRGGAAYVVGGTSSTNFPTAPSPPFQATLGGGFWDGFVTNITPAAADLSVIKAGPSSAIACSPVTYSIVVTNNGPDDATRVDLVDTLSSALTPVSVTTTVGFCTASAGTVTCDLTPLASGASAVVGLTVVPPSGILFDTAVATGRETDLDPANNTGTAATLVWTPPWCWFFGCPPC
jgi:uncharacterized repeat protein (TIGR01451 family)